MGKGYKKEGLGNEILLFGFLRERAEVLGERVRNSFYFSAPFRHNVWSYRSYKLLKQSISDVAWFLPKYTWSSLGYVLLNEEIRLVCSNIRPCIWPRVRPCAHLVMNGIGRHWRFNHTLNLCPTVIILLGLREIHPILLVSCWTLGEIWPSPALLTSALCTSGSSK